MTFRWKQQKVKEIPMCKEKSWVVKKESEDKMVEKLRQQKVRKKPSSGEYLWETFANVACLYYQEK